MECRTCHHHNSPTANFCEHCGAPLAADPHAATAPLADPPPITHQETPFAMTSTAPTTDLDPSTTATFDDAARPAPASQSAAPPWPESPPAPDPAQPSQMETPAASADPFAPQAQPAPVAGEHAAPWHAAPTADPPPAEAVNWIDLRRPEPPPPGWAPVPPALLPTAPSAKGDSRLWAIGAHASAIVGGFMGGIPAFVGPLIVWLVRKNDDPYAAAHGRDALNFNLSVLLYGVLLVLGSIVTFGLGALIAIPILLVFPFAWLVLSIIGAVKAANNETYRYPLTITFFR